MQGIRNGRVWALALCAAIIGTPPAQAAWLSKHEVFGVGEEDMLKLRAGPGTGFVVIVGLPDGTVVRVKRCDRTGPTRWCEVALDAAPSLRGWVSDAYLRER